MWLDQSATAADLFKKDWCHPVATSMDDKQALIKCDAFSATECATTGLCEYGNVEDMLPTGAFCAPELTMPYPAYIASCMKKTSLTTCD